MSDYRDRISSHSQFDDERHWVFVRNTKLPRGTFDNSLSPDMVVVIVCCVIGIAFTVALLLGYV